jgi:hypothetical protein
MNNIEDIYSQFEAYSIGAMAKEERIKFLNRIRNDNEFYKEYLLWERIDKLLEQIPAYDLKTALKIDEKDTKIIPVDWTKYFKYKIAVSFAGLLLLGYGIYNYFVNQGPNLITKQIKYSEINIPNQGRGAFSNDTLNVVSKNINITAEKLNQHDTTYQFTFEPLIFKFGLPRKN